eukprot:1715763-Rhodomonas_salina.2
MGLEMDSELKVGLGGTSSADELSIPTLFAVCNGTDGGTSTREHTLGGATSFKGYAAPGLKPDHGECPWGAGEPCNSPWCRCGGEVSLAVSNDLGQYSSNYQSLSEAEAVRLDEYVAGRPKLMKQCMVPVAATTDCDCCLGLDLLENAVGAGVTAGCRCYAGAQGG